MKTTLGKVASAFSFAHLAGIGRSNAKAKAEDDKPEDDEDGKPKSKKAESDEDKKKDDDNRDSEYAEDDDTDASAEDDKPDDGDDKDDKKSKKAKGSKASDDEDDDEKMQAGAKKERARCAAIFAAPSAAGNVALAAQLAFSTDLSPEAAVKVLDAAPAAQRGPNVARAARNPNVGASGSLQQSPQQAAAARLDQNLKAAMPSRKR